MVREVSRRRLGASAIRLVQRTSTLVRTPYAPRCTIAAPYLCRVNPPPPPPKLHSQAITEYSSRGPRPCLAGAHAPVRQILHPRRNLLSSAVPPGGSCALFASAVGSYEIIRFLWCRSLCQRIISVCPLRQRNVCAHMTETHCTRSRSRALNILEHSSSLCAKYFSTPSAQTLLRAIPALFPCRPVPPPHLRLARPSNLISSPTSPLELHFEFKLASRI